jgi:hypothetical protein
MHREGVKSALDTFPAVVFEDQGSGMSNTGQEMVTSG